MHQQTQSSYRRKVVLKISYNSFEVQYTETLGSLKQGFWFTSVNKMPMQRISSLAILTLLRRFSLTDS